MMLHKFDRNVALKRFKLKHNKHYYFKIFTLILGVIVLVCFIIYFFFSKFLTSNKYNVVETTVGSFSKSKNLVEYLKGIQSSNTSTMYYDGTTDNNLRYYGSNPNNYVSFNGELWRIIGVMNNMTTSDGTNASLVKLVRSESIGNYSWDSSASSINSGLGVNEWSQADIMTELNSGAYWNRTSGTCYNGSNNASTTCDFSQNGLTTAGKEMIQSVVWHTGGWNSDAVLRTDMYNYERGTNVYSGRTSSWIGNVGLIYPSDYGYATNVNLCTVNLENYNSTVCHENDWIGTYGTLSLITPFSNSTYYNYDLGPGGYLGRDYVYGGYVIVPSLYLKASTLYTGGTGTSSDPYTITNGEFDFDYTGGEQTFTAPISGYYKFEAWGANGAYTSGKLNVNKDFNIYVYVGQQSQTCNPYTSCSGVSYNGGGSGGYFTQSNYPLRTNGGNGATDFRITNGLWNDVTSLKSRIMVAAGSAGVVVADVFNGFAGGISGYSGIAYGTGGYGGGGTQISGGTIGVTGATAGSFGQGGNGWITNYTCANRNDGYGGGGGYYGGGGGTGTTCTATDNNSGNGGGGSSYISGHTGCVAIASSTSTNARLGTNSATCTTGTSDELCSEHYSGYVFADTIMIDAKGYQWTNSVGTTVVGMPTHNGTSTMTMNSGNGYAKITYIGSTLN